MNNCEIRNYTTRVIKEKFTHCPIGMVSGFGTVTSTYVAKLSETEFQLYNEIGKYKRNDILTLQQYCQLFALEELPLGKYKTMTPEEYKEFIKKEQGEA